MSEYDDMFYAMNPSFDRERLLRDEINAGCESGTYLQEEDSAGKQPKKMIPTQKTCTP